METPFAVFAVVKVSKGIAATTRPADRHNDDQGAGKFGLPGGKVDAGETAIQAVVREAAEEGWDISGNISFAHSATVQGKVVHWFTADSAVAKTSYKEMGRIATAIAQPSDMVTFGNDIAIPICINKL